MLEIYRAYLGVALCRIIGTWADRRYFQQYHLESRVDGGIELKSRYFSDFR
jgi:hypothetical protein